MFRNRLKTPIIGLAISSILMLLLALGTSGPAFACGSPNCIDITGGTLGSSLASLTLASSTLTLDGTNHSIAITGGSPLVTVTDATGTGSGWSLSVSATQFNDGSGDSLANSYIQVNPAPDATAACDGSNTCTVPTDGHSNVCSVASISHGAAAPVAGPIGDNGNSSVLLCNAAAITGLGAVDMTPTLSFKLPGNVYSSVMSGSSATTFSTTITLTTSSFVAG